MRWKQTLLLCTAILLVGGAVTAIIFFTEPTAARSGATKTTAMLVDVMEVQRETVQPTVEAMGTVVPAQDIVLRPRVGGEIIRRADAFTPGGYVRKGDVLLQIDPSDYEHALRQRQSELRQALADLEVERWQRDIAEREYRLRGDTLDLSEQNRAVALREPQFDAAQSRVESGRAAVAQAELDLERTTVRAPFDAHILRRDANLGSQVGPGDALGRLVGLDTYWVEATVPLAKLRWLPVSGDGRSGATVRIRNRTAWDEGEFREGRLAEVLGALEGETRMARVLVAVSDPHARQSENRSQPRLMIGAYVETQMKARVLQDVVRLDREYVRDGDTVWVMEDGALRIRDAQIVFRDAEHAYIQEGLESGDRVVTTNLSSVSDGAPLRLEGTNADADDLPDPAE